MRERLWSILDVRCLSKLSIKTGEEMQQNRIFGLFLLRTIFSAKKNKENCGTLTARILMISYGIVNVLHQKGSVIAYSHILV